MTLNYLVQGPQGSGSHMRQLRMLESFSPRAVMQLSIQDIASVGHTYALSRVFISKNLRPVWHSAQIFVCLTTSLL